MDNLEQKMLEFCQTISETKEWQAYDKAARAYESDKAAQKMLEDLQMARGALDILEQGGFSGQEKQKKLCDDLLESVRANRVINDWFDARKKVETLVGELAVAISGNINFPFALPPKKSCGCSG